MDGDRPQFNRLLLELFCTSCQTPFLRFCSLFRTAWKSSLVSALCGDDDVTAAADAADAAAALLAAALVAAALQAIPQDMVRQLSCPQSSSIGGVHVL